MKLKRIVGMLLICTMVLASLSACTKNDTPANTSENGATDGDTQNADNNQDSGEVVTLKWIQVGNGMPANYDAWKAQINPYLEEKIGVNIEMEIVPWGEWESRRNVIANSGEYFDILFTDAKRYNTEVNMGVFADITDIIKNSNELYDYVPEDLWTATLVDDKIYAIPTYKDSSMSNWWIWDKAIVEKYNVDAPNLTTFESLTDTLREIKDGEGTAPFYLNQTGTVQATNHVDNMGTGIHIIGVKYDDSERKAVNILEDEDFLSDMDIVHQWYNEGIINADAPSTNEAPAYKMLSIAQGWASAAQTMWGPNMGMDAIAYQYGKSMLSNTTVRGSLNGIYSGSKYPEKCIEFLQLVNLDSHVRSLFYYGVEGENFEYNDKGEINKLNNNWEMAGYTQGTYFTIPNLADLEFNQWEEIKVLNENAVPSVILGFNLDSANIETEIVNCRAVWEKYRSELLTGAKEPRELAAKITEELKSAGLETLLNEMQTQIDAYFK